MLCQTPRLACRVAFPLWTPGWHSIWLSAAAASWRVPLRFHDSTAGRIRSVKLQTGTYTCLSYISSYSLSSSKHWEFVWFRQILGGLCTWNCGVTYIFSGGNAKVKGQNFAFWNSLTAQIDEACWFMNNIWFPHYYSHLHCPIRNKIISLYWHFPALWSCTMQTSIFPYDPQLHISTLRQLIEIHIKPPPSTWTIFKFSFLLTMILNTSKCLFSLLAVNTTFYFLFAQELPVRASAYMDNALRPLHQLLTDSTGLVTPSTAQEWLRVTLSECTQRSANTQIKNPGWRFMKFHF